MDKSQIKYIRVEIPCDLHYKFTRRIIEVYGTSKAQNEALTTIISDYINSKKQIKATGSYSEKRSKGRVISQPLTSKLKDKFKQKARKDIPDRNYLQKAVISIIENYVND